MRNDIEEILKYGPKSIIKKLEIKEGDNSVIIRLSRKRICKENMQDDGNDFEGWSFVSHFVTGKEVVLEIKNDYNSVSNSEKRHLRRFLYRVMKFIKQYRWFKVSNDLKNEVDDFEEYLTGGLFKNNYGKKEAGNTKKNNDENYYEAKFAEDGLLRKEICVDIGDEKVHRQLAVGLYERDVKEGNEVFPVNKAAIDLWVINGDTINVVELKTKNVMMGIITEIFFYSNYIYDLIKDNGLFTLSKPDDKDVCRGYDELWDKKSHICKVNGIMLADEYHPWIKDCLSVMKENGLDDLDYYMENYKLDSY